MPPCITPYVLTERTEQTVRRFIDLYVDEAAADVGLSESDLTFFPRDPSLVNDVDAFTWEPGKDLESAIRRGLQDRVAAYVLYLPPTKGDCHAMIGFTYDGKVVFGLDVDDPLNQPEPLAKATTFLNELMDVFETDQGFLCVEQPPPMTVEDFQQAMQQNQDWVNHR